MKIIAAAIGLVLCSSAYSTSPKPLSVWQDVSLESQLASRELVSRGFNNHAPIKKRTLSLNEKGLKDLLIKESQSSSLRSRTLDLEPTEVDFPLPDGSFARVKISESSILSTEITAQYPNIKTWHVVGVDDPAISGSIDFTSKGFMACW